MEVSVGFSVFVVAHLLSWVSSPSCVSNGLEYEGTKLCESTLNLATEWFARPMQNGQHAERHFREPVPMLSL